MNQDQPHRDQLLSEMERQEHETAERRDPEQDQRDERRLARPVDDRDRERHEARRGGEPVHHRQAERGVPAPESEAEERRPAEGAEAEEDRGDRERAEDHGALPSGGPNAVVSMTADASEFRPTPP